jgi:hypothetical protein
MQIKSQQSKIQVKIGQRTYLGQQEDYFISLPLTDVRYRPSGENEGQDIPKTEWPWRISFQICFVRLYQRIPNADRSINTSTGKINTMD